MVLPGTGKTLLAKAVANQTSATFLRVGGFRIDTKIFGRMVPKLVRELFRVAEEHAPSIVFIDEIDAVGTKNLDGFDSRGDVKVIMATIVLKLWILPLIRPGRIDRKIEFPCLMKKRNVAFSISTHRDDLSGADIKAICTEAGLMALRERSYESH
ncbi:hypothetical protein DOY81_011705 [Sarcophaga bullata]|nr:hypothetical protein DOY81_011705 [Sarcophaga bullata]